MIKVGDTVQIKRDYEVEAEVVSVEFAHSACPEDHHCRKIVVEYGDGPYIKTELRVREIKEIENA